MEKLVTILLTLGFEQIKLTDLGTHGLINGRIKSKLWIGFIE